MARHLTSAVLGFRYLLVGRFWTPSEHRSALASWTGDRNIPETELRQILDSWQRQQAVAWWLGRTVSWSVLLYGIRQVWL
jgi:hypothetical protein